MTAPADLDALPDEPNSVLSIRKICGESTEVFEDAEIISYIDALRAHCQRNIRARKLTERERLIATTELEQQIKRAESAEARASEYFKEWQEECNDHTDTIARAKQELAQAEARVREMFERTKERCAEVAANYSDPAAIYLEIRALQPEQPDERKE